MSEVGTRGRAGCVLVGLAYPVMTVLGLVLHLWTIVIAFSASGFGAALLTLIFPVFSELYWGRQIWKVTGTVLNEYCGALLAYAALWLVMIVGFSLMESVSGRGDR